MGVHIYTDEWHPGENTIAYYPFYDGNNGCVGDMSGNGHHLYNGTNCTYERLDQSTGKHCGVSDGTARPYSDAISFSTNCFTISCWINITELQQTGRWPFSLYWGNGKELGMLYGTNYSPKLNIYFGQFGGASGTNMIGINPEINTRYHFCVIIDQTANPKIQKVYVNSNYIGENSSSSTVGGTSFTVNLFGSSNNLNNTKCKISEFIIERGNWSVDKITNYYNATKIYHE